MKPQACRPNDDLTPEEMTTLASLLEAMARMYRLRAEEHQRRRSIDERAQERLRTLAGSADIVAAYTAQGMALAQAIGVTERATGINPDTLRHYWRQRLDITDQPTTEH